MGWVDYDSHLGAVYRWRSYWARSESIRSDLLLVVLSISLFAFVLHNFQRAREKQRRLHDEVRPLGLFREVLAILSAFF